MAETTGREFSRQVDTLLAKGYPALADLSDDHFLALLEPLRSQLVAGKGAPTGSGVAFVVVPTFIPAEELVPTLTLATSTAAGILDRNHGADGLAPYKPLPELDVPDAPAYLLVDVERGDEFRGVPPADATAAVLSRGRTPLTIHEGIALVTQHPALLEKNHCFMLSGSRRGDRRVPAMWISGSAPKLGWCWEGNPHSWLGTASAVARLA